MKGPGREELSFGERCWEWAVGRGWEGVRPAPAQHRDTGADWSHPDTASCQLAAQKQPLLLLGHLLKEP